MNRLNHVLLGRLHRRALVAVGALLISLLSVFPASGQIPNRYDSLLAEGLAHLAQQDWDTALYLFDVALFENPGGVEALYYRGVTQARAGHLDKAERSLTEALSADPAFIPAYFDLGVLYYQRGWDDQALEAFDAVQRADPDRARVYYYQGLILLRNGRSPEAAAKLEQAAALDPRLAPQAHFHAGEAYADAGEHTTARKSFAYAASLAPGTEIGDLAEARLRGRRQSLRAGKWWDIRLAAGLQYDDNVIIDPRGGLPAAQGITEKDDVVGVVSLRGRLRWWDTPAWIGSGAYRFYQNWHRDEALSENFTIQDHQLAFETGPRIGSTELTLGYEGQYATLGGESYVLAHAVGPRWVIPSGRTGFTELRYQFGVRDYKNTSLFPTNTDRDVQVHRPGVTQYILLPGEGYLRLGYAFEHERAGDSPTEDDWTFNGHRPGAGVMLPLWTAADLTLDGEYIIRNFDQPNEQPPGPGVADRVKREDEEVVARVALSQSFGPYVELTLHYLYQYNNSNISIYEYTRNVLGILLTATY